MKNNQRVFRAIASAICMFLLIINAKESIHYAVDGLKLCATSVIPALFPFLFLAIICNSTFFGYRFRCLRFLTSLCHMPAGSEPLFVLGILGGYPVGAQVIAAAYQQGSLKKRDAERMLGFCNNAGPAFIFGILGPMFDSIVIPAILWFIQILSALITGTLSSNIESKKIEITGTPPLSITEALEKAVKTISLICGWVILFRIVIGFLEGILMDLVPRSIVAVINGLLELSNGCIGLCAIEQTGLRFILSSLFLSVGGLCVTLQTASAVNELKLNIYWKYKLIQGFVSMITAYIVQCFILQPEQQFLPAFLPVIVCVIPVFIIILFYCKKIVAFQKKLVYN